MNTDHLIMLIAQVITMESDKRVGVTSKREKLVKSFTQDAEKAASGRSSPSRGFYTTEISNKKRMKRSIRRRNTTKEKVGREKPKDKIAELK